MGAGLMESLSRALVSGYMEHKIDLRIGILDDLVTTQYGQMCEWVLYTPFMYLEDMSIGQPKHRDDPRRIRIRRCHHVRPLTYDGATYGKEFTEAYGSPGNRNKRYIVNRLGYVRNWVGFKLVACPLLAWHLAWGISKLANFPQEYIGLALTDGEVKRLPVGQTRWLTIIRLSLTAFACWLSPLNTWLSARGRQRVLLPQTSRASITTAAQVRYTVTQ